MSRDKKKKKMHITRVQYSSGETNIPSLLMIRYVAATMKDYTGISGFYLQDLHTKSF